MKKNKKIKILYTIPNFDTAGSGKVVYDLVRSLDKNKFSPEICCFHNRGVFFKEVEKLGVPIHIFNFTETYRPYFSLFHRTYKIVSFFKKNKFDIIHSWHWSSDFTEPLAAKIAGIPYVYTKKAMSWGNKAWKIRSWLSTKIIVLNSDMIPLFFKKSQKKTKLIYLGVDENLYPIQEKAYTTPNGLKFDTSDFIIVTVANLVPIKGIEYLINAVDDISDSRIKLLIIGNNNNDYGQLLINNTKNKNIYFINKQLDVTPYQAIADVFIIPTKTVGEGLPLAPLEAMASQRIVLGSNVAGVKEVLANFQNCLFEPKNSNAIVEKIKMIQNLSVIERNNLAIKMRKEIESNFTLDICINNHEMFYLSMIN